MLNYQKKDTVDGLLLLTIQPNRKSAATLFLINALKLKPEGSFLWIIVTIYTWFTVL